VGVGIPKNDPHTKVHCQTDRVRELISRREMRPTDQHADEAKADDTDRAVTGHLRSKVATDRPACGVGRNLVCMSVSWSHFLSRNQAHDVGPRVNHCAGASQKRADLFSQRYIQDFSDM